MKKILLAATLALIPMFALAAPTGYKNAADCQVPPDHGVYAGPNGELTGCITADAWNAAQTVSLGDQANLQAFIFRPGTTKVGSNGVTYTCPWWFFMFDCVLPPGAR